jgi:hypothetical protein
MMLVDMDICFNAQLIYSYMLYFNYDSFIEISLVSFMVDEGDDSLHLVPYDAMCSGFLVILIVRCCSLKLVPIGPYLASILHSIYLV